MIYVWGWGYLFAALVVLSGVFFTAFLSPEKQVLINVNALGEANLEAILIFLLLPASLIVLRDFRRFHYMEEYKENVCESDKRKEILLRIKKSIREEKPDFDIHKTSRTQIHEKKDIPLPRRKARPARTEKQLLRMMRKEEKKDEEETVMVPDWDTPRV